MKHISIKIIINLLLIFLTIKLSAQNENEIERRLRIKNKISEMLTYSFDLNTGDSLLIDHNFYDKNGNLIKDLRYDEKKKVIYKYILKYNLDGLMVKQIGYNRLDSISTILIYEYDKDRNQIDYKQLRPNGLVLIHQKRTYNEQGQNIELYNKQRNNNSFYISQKYFYNTYGKYTKIQSFNVDGILESSYEYEYDDQGNLIFIYKIENQERSLSYIYKYNVKNLQIESKGKSQMSQYTYDYENNLIEKRTFEKDTLIDKTRFYFKKFNK